MRQWPARGVLSREGELDLCRKKAKELRMLANKLKLDHNKAMADADAMEDYCLDIEEQIVQQKGWVE